MIFIPVSNPEFIDTAKIWNKRRLDKHPQKAEHEIVVNDSQNKFKNLSNNEDLYIHSHGGARASEGKNQFIGHREVRDMSAYELATSLKNAGLKKSHKKIKLWTCKSAGKRNKKKDLPEHTFAGQFLLNMRALGYKDLSVYGF